MSQPPFISALKGAGVGLTAAVPLNLLLLVAAGDALHFPGEMTPWHVAGFTLAAIPFAAAALWLLPRWFPLIAFTVALASSWFSFSEFGRPAGWWLLAMHVVAAAGAVLGGQRLTGTSRSGSGGRGRASAAAALVLVFAAGAAVPVGAEEEPVRLLVYTATYGWHHDSITTARARFAELAAGPEFEVTVTADPSRITGAELARHDVLVLLNISGEQPWSERQKADLVSWVRSGGGVVGTHSAIDANYSWPEYGRILGAHFHSHPHTGVATNVVEAPDHPIVAHLPNAFSLNEEYYRWQLNPRPNVRVLTSLDASSAGWWSLVYDDGQPLTWCQDYHDGRSFYTALGHFDETWHDPGFWEMVLQGLHWASGRIEADCSADTDPDVLQAEEAEIGLGRVTSHTEEGAALAVSHILTQGHLQFADVDLTGVSALEVRVSTETPLPPRPYHFVTPLPAVGGNIHVRLDATVDDDAEPSGCWFYGQCNPADDLASATVLPGPPGWDTVRIDLPEPLEGTRDLFLVFTDDLAEFVAPSRLFVPEATDYHYLFSIDWVRLVRD